MKNLFLRILLITSFYILIYSAKPRSRYVILWRRINCTYNSNYMRHFYCNIIQPEQKYISQYIVYAKDIYPGYMVKAHIDVLRPNGKMLNILNLDVDVCKFFAKEHENNLIKIVKQSLDEHSNYTECPFYKDITFGLFNWTIDVSKLPYAPETEFVVNFIYSVPPHIETGRFNLIGSLELRRKRPMRVFT